MSTTVTGKLENLGQGNVSQGTFVRFYLRGAGGNQPRVNGTAIIAPTLGNVYYFDFVPNASGVISGTLWSTRDATGLLGGDIETGGVNTAVWYGMVVYSNGKAGPETPIHAKNTTTFDISNVTPITTNPVVTAPTGDSTYARLDGGNMPFTGNVSAGSNSITAGSAIFGGATANPWIDVTHPTYGAKCDGVTNDVVAIQAAINACHALGSNSCRVVFPPASICNINSGLTNFSGISLEGQSQQSGQFATKIRYTASGTTPALACSGAACNVSLRNIEFTYSNASFTGALISNTGAAANIVMDGVIIDSDNSILTNAAYLLDITNSNSNFITRCQFGGSTKGINATGAVLTSITNSVFGGAFGPITSTYIDNPGESLNLIGNDFEFIGEPTTGGPIVVCTSGCFGSLFAGNWVGDFPTTWVGSLFKSTHGMTITGNSFHGPASGTGGTLIDNSATGSTAAYSFVGNTTLGKWANIFNHNAAVQGIEVSGNLWGGTITTFLTGTVPASGILVDPNGNSIIPFFVGNPATVYGAGTGPLVIQANTNGVIAMENANGLTDSKWWEHLLGTTSYTLRTLNDAKNAGSNFWVANRTGNVATNFTMVAPLIVNNGPQAAGVAAGLAGTGACATITTQTGGSWVGSAKCTGTTGASTLTITPGTTAPNGWVCNVQDETTRANLFQQTGHAPTTCTLTATSVTQNDVFVFSAFAF